MLISVEPLALEEAVGEDEDHNQPSMEEMERRLRLPAKSMEVMKGFHTVKDLKVMVTESDIRPFSSFTRIS